MKKFFAILIAKQAVFWSQILGKGGGGALPGLIAEKIYPDIIYKLSQKLPKGVIVITGTNGKTTTARMVTQILQNSGLRVVNNQDGSNLSRGLASALIAKTSCLTGKIKEDIGVYEIDEATMAPVLTKLKPRIIAITNIFRDQLDRYGEVDKTASIIEEAVLSSPQSILVLNADDPMVSFMGKDNESHFFGLEETATKTTSELALDSRSCFICGTELNFSTRYYSHLGVYACPKCGFKSPKAEITAKKIVTSKEAVQATILHNGSEKSLTLPLTGIYNVYNSLAAILITSLLGVKDEIIFSTLNKFSSAFGRMEKIEIDGKTAFIYLIKNPTGANQVLETLSSFNERGTALIILNDNFADGTDISWIWDTNFEIANKIFNHIVVSGIRAEDLALRLKYAGSVTFHLEKDLKKSLDQAIAKTKENETLYILCTYTAMLSLRDFLVKEKIVANYWKENNTTKGLKRL